MLILYLCGMGKAWSEVILSKRLVASLEKENKLSDFEDFIRGDLTRVIGIKLAENGINLTDDIKSQINFTKETEKNGDVLYHAAVFVGNLQNQS